MSPPLTQSYFDLSVLAHSSDQQLCYFILQFMQFLGIPVTQECKRFVVNKLARNARFTHQVRDTPRANAFLGGGQSVYELSDRSLASCNNVRKHSLSEQPRLSYADSRMNLEQWSLFGYGISYFGSGGSGSVHIITNRHLRTRSYVDPIT